MAALPASEMWSGVRKLGWPTSRRMASGMVMATFEISRMPEWWASRTDGESGGREVTAAILTGARRHLRAALGILRPPPRSHRVLAARRGQPDSGHGRAGGGAGHARDR